MVHLAYHYGWFFFYRIVGSGLEEDPFGWRHGGVEHSDWHRRVTLAPLCCQEHTLEAIGVGGEELLA